MSRKIMKGDRICTTKWKRKLCGTVIRRRKKSVFVLWDGLKFTEDEIDITEVRKVKGRVKDVKPRGIFIRKLLKGFER